MAIQKEHWMMLGHLQPKKMDKSQLDEMLDNMTNLLTTETWKLSAEVDKKDEQKYLLNMGSNNVNSGVM